MNGRDYFAYWASQLELDDKDASAVLHESDADNLEHGSPESRLGGRLTHRDLKRLTPEETAERRERSIRFLKKPAKTVASEESDSEE